MKPFAHLFLLPALLLSACGLPASSSAPLPVPVTAGGPIRETATATSQTQSRAALIEVRNQVRYRPSEDDDFSDARAGQELPPRSQVQTGQDSRAALALLPENTVVRIGPESLFTVQSPGNEPESAPARLQLFFGQLWIVLRGGQLEVETEDGLAAVRGSMMGVSLDPDRATMSVTCLEGHCSLENDLGKTDLTAGQACDAKKGSAPSAPRPLTEAEQREWRAAFPESPAQATPANGTGPGSTPEPAGTHVNTRPLKYHLVNACMLDGQPAGAWDWEFKNLATGEVKKLSIPPGQTADGSLPPGQYEVNDWWPNGDHHGPQFMESDFGSLNVTCAMNIFTNPSGGPGQPPPSTP
jgi:hypothetical protein